MKPSELIALKAAREGSIRNAARHAAEQRRADLESVFIRRVQDELGLTEADGWQYAVEGDGIALTHPALAGQANLQPRGNHIMLINAGAEIPITNANITVLLEFLTPKPKVGADLVSAPLVSARKKGSKSKP